MANTRALWKVRCYPAAAGFRARVTLAVSCEGMKLSGQGTALAAHCILQDQAYFEIKIIAKGARGPPVPPVPKLLKSSSVCRRLRVWCRA